MSMTTAPSMSLNASEQPAILRNGNRLQSNCKEAQKEQLMENLCLRLYYIQAETQLKTEE